MEIQEVWSKELCKERVTALTRKIWPLLCDELVLGSKELLSKRGEKKGKIVGEGGERGNQKGTKALTSFP